MDGCTHLFGVYMDVRHAFGVFMDVDTFLLYVDTFLVVYGYPYTCWYLCRNTHRNTSIHMLVLSCCTFLLYIFGCRNVLVQILSLFYMDVDAFIFRYFFGYINVCERDTFLIRCVSC